VAVVLSKTEALGLGDTLGTILAAVIDAQARSARATVEFINDVGFIPRTGAPGAPDQLRTVKFSYFKRDENDQRSEFTIEMPLLAMVDIPLVVVKKATVSFAYEITEAKSAPAGANGLPAKIGRAANIKGRIVEQGPSGQERANLQVSIELEKSPLPLGLDRMLDVLQVATSERKSSGPNA
jgi:hypothetical protein